MARAEQLLQIFITAVKPPRGCALGLRERPPRKDDPDTPNWIAFADHMPLDALVRWDSAYRELARQHRRIDWEGITEMEGGMRRIAREMS